MRTRVNLRKDVGDDAVLINDIRDAARKTGAPSPIRFAQDMVRIAQQREAKAGIIGKGFVVFDRIKTHAENLHVALREGVIEGEEPAPFGGSPTGAGFGIKPQDDLFATEIAKHTVEPSCAVTVKSGACDPTASIWGLLSSRPSPCLSSVNSDMPSPLRRTLPVLHALSDF